MTLFLPTLRQAAPRLSRDFFVCRHCLSISPATRRTKSVASRLAFTRSNTTLSQDIARKIKDSPLGNLSKTIIGAPKPPSSALKPPSLKPNSSFPDVSSNGVAYWLLGSAASVFGLVVFGGLTRLTESGLSITEWRPVAGSLPPLSAADWDLEFSKYRASPEFKLLNPHMTLEEFKKIYFMEWGHRLWGRFVGLSFVFPAIYFVARKKVTKSMAVRLFGISALIGFQGFLGWYMVKSGLKDDLFAPGSHPRVSQYRLTAHLGTAFLCYTAMLWNGLSILRDNRLLSLSPNRAFAQLQQLKLPVLSVFRKGVAGVMLLVFCTAMSGGLVAGLDAGMIYNEFPRMGNGLHPPKSELFDVFYSRRDDRSDLWWRNMLENPSTVQLDHRVLATTTFTTILSLWAYSRFNKKVKGAMPNSVRKGMLGVVHLLFLQVTLGISTLIYLCPVPLAAAHQAGALGLLTGTLILGNRVWVPKSSLRLVQQRLKQAAAVTAKPRGLGGASFKADLQALRRNGPPIENV